MTIIRAFLVPFVVAGLTGCMVGQDDPPTDPGTDLPDGPSIDTTDQVTKIDGIDYGYARPSESGLHSEGYRFVVRYLSYDNGITHGKILFGGEANAIQHAGLDLVVVWEFDAADALGGFGAGVADAKEANRQALNAGMPPDRPIYFAVDFDATPGDQTAINAYLDGAASVIGRHRVGVYGDYYVVERSFDAGKATYGWQTYAWSGGQWDSRAHIRQYLNGVTAGFVFNCCDRDESERNDFGQWSYHNELYNPHSGKCMDVDSSGTTNGTNIQLYSCNGGGAQGFRVTPIGATKYVNLVNTNSGKCVDVALGGTTNHTNIDLWGCNGTEAQKFEIRTSGDYVELKNPQSDKCIDIDGDGTTNHTNIQLYTCNGTPAQQWDMLKQ
jgi:hypothetical protein